MGQKVSKGKEFRGGGNKHNPASCRPLVRTQETPQRGREGGQRVSEEKRAEVAEVLLAVGRCLLALLAPTRPSSSQGKGGGSEYSLVSR